MRGAGVAVEERVRTEDDGGVGGIDQFRDDPVVQRTGVKEDLATGHQRQQDAAGQSEGSTASAAIWYCGGKGRRLRRVFAAEWLYPR